MHDCAVVDTSCLIALEKIGLLNILCRLYRRILLPQTVIQEFGGKPDLNCAETIEIESSVKRLLIEELNLGNGESEVIALAYGQKMRVVIDDLKARKVAEKLGLKVTGTIGILCRAQREKLLTSAYMKVAKLKEKGFRVTDDILQDLKKD